MRYFTIEDLQSTPSRKHKIEEEEEIRCRARAVAFILRCGHQLKLKYTTMATAAIYFQTFYFRRSLKLNDKYDIATSCLYFASKVEEDRKRVIEIMETAYFFRNNKKIADPRSTDKARTESETECSKIRDLELTILQTLEFDFDVEQPFGHLGFILRVWMEQHTLLTGLMLDDDAQLNIMRYYMKIAWFFAVDTLKMVNIVMNAQEHLAVACTELAIRYVEIAFHLQQNKENKSALESDQDFDFEKLDQQTNILPHDIFTGGHCLLQLESDWWMQFDDLLTRTVLNELCVAILDVADLENSKSQKPSQWNRMYVDKELLKKMRVPRNVTISNGNGYHVGINGMPFNAI